MGKILDSWLARNSQALQALTPGGGVRLQQQMPPPSFYEDPAAPVRPEPGFGVMAPGDSSFPPGGTAPSSFTPRTPVAALPKPAPQELEGPPAPTRPAQPKGGGDALSIKQMLEEMSDDELEQSTAALTEQGTNPREAYTRLTGNPPPRDMKKREISEFLLEFGLGLLAVPAGRSDAEAFGAAGLNALQGHRGRQAAQAEQAISAEETAYQRSRDAVSDQREERRYSEERLDKSFDRQAKIAELAIRQQEAEARMGRPTNGQYNHYVGDDGFMYSYDEATGQGVRVEVNGSPIKPDPKMTSSGDRKLDFEVKYNMYLDTYGKRPDGSQLAGGDLQRVQRQALEFANRTSVYTESEAQREAVKGAVDLLAKDSNYLMADPDEKGAMRSAMVTELKQLYLGQNPQATGGAPDPSKLAAGMATPVTGDDGKTEYWTLGDDGQPRKVDPAELE